ncbi:MAG TPA: prepilin-type N-terminal cleavage/methylation domain-containing protein [Planctomycetota bacterium]|nr:prepilin-type N-terminal cleavage/methylation domain-containing protein [Planctomycetota bacterium]OQC21702.1 MAG: hypothetical protein BWX69_00632 [Planctomycetes bacterium ADurb.Bin069]NMD36641.1 prepilin-type N-terminal cleavage/methylation domain-containing protein [Planctomycetota bacterium]HNR98918.1 prepilin-type N-terminal cleavage/methylation domain-containing protein [Planctomycetota bacterium]HNU26007.1 prepilin-type N-terminal cleavage/methylation domain-containing protein [Planc
MARARRGFTLIEMLVVAALMGAVFAAAAARFDRIFVRTHLEASAHGLGDHFAYAVQRAYTTGSYHTFVLDLEAGRYRIKLGRESEEARELLERSLGRGVRFTDVQVAFQTYLPPGVLQIEISPLGVTNDIVINLRDAREKELAVALNALVQSIEYFDERKDYEELQDDPAW